MPTQKPLRDMIPEIIDHFNDHADYLDFNYKIYKVLNGQLKEEVECSLQQEIISKSALRRALQRIPSVNVLKSTTDKLSKVYVEKPTRMSDSPEDMEIMYNIAKSANINTMLKEANAIYNAAHAVAIEPYVEGTHHRLRVLAPHQFLPYSDDPTNPQNMTVFIKLMGRRVEHYGPVFATDGTLLRDEESREVDIMALYSDNEFLVIDSLGKPREDIMLKMGVTTSVNRLGRIPFVHKSKNRLQMIPYPNQAGYDMSVLISKLYTDLNFAAQFMSHSIIYTRDTDLGDQVLNPDAVIHLGHTEEGGQQPFIGTINPELDIENQIKLIMAQLESHLDQVGIKVNLNKNVTREASGVAKSIDEGDTTDQKKIQTEVFREIEEDLWSLMEGVQQFWAPGSSLNEKRRFSSTFADSFRIQFAEMRKSKTEKQKLEEIQLWREQGLMTKKQALRSLRPDFTESQIDAWLSEVEDEFERSMEMGLPLATANTRTSDGQFTEGNTEATNDPQVRLEAERNSIDG